MTRTSRGAPGHQAVRRADVEGEVVPEPVLPVRVGIRESAFSCLYAASGKKAGWAEARVPAGHGQPQFGHRVAEGGRIRTREGAGLRPRARARRHRQGGLATGGVSLCGLLALSRLSWSRRRSYRRAAIRSRRRWPGGRAATRRANQRRTLRAGPLRHRGAADQRHPPRHLIRSLRHVRIRCSETAETTGRRTGNVGGAGHYGGMAVESPATGGHITGSPEGWGA